VSGSLILLVEYCPSCKNYVAEVKASYSQLGDLWQPALTWSI